MNSIRKPRVALLTGTAALALFALPFAAQAQLSSAQQSALKANCRSDFMSHCSGVTPGGKDALMCLQKNVDSLSPGCKTAVSATMPKPAEPAPAAAKAEPAPVAAPSAAKVVSAPPPKAAIAHPTTKKTVEVSAAPIASAKPPTAAQQSALKSSCRSDFMSHCSGVTPGGKEALACLEKNVARLSPACQKAVRAIAPGGPATATAVAAPVVEPEPHRGGFVPGAGVILKACARSLVIHCRGIIGDGKAVACLKAAKASGKHLGFRCNAALKITSRLR